MTSMKAINKTELATKGESIYAKLKEKLEKDHWGKFVAIDVDSGDYFLGKSFQEADEKAREKYPNSVFYVVRIGRRATWVRR